MRSLGASVHSANSFRVSFLCVLLGAERVKRLSPFGEEYQGRWCHYWEEHYLAPLEFKFSQAPSMVLWVFGYGSLVWKAGFEYDERVVGFIKGYTRVFNQASTDHRGTPEYPGRTVTLEPQEGARTAGCAYRVSGYDAEQLVLSYLELREFEYDIRAFVDFYTDESPNKPAITGVLVYIGSPNRLKNQYYLGPAPLRDMASQIATARGPAGPNYEYLFRLEEALCEIGCEDEYIIELANEVRKLLRVYEDEKLLQAFQDGKLPQDYDDDKLLEKYENRTSFDDQKLL